MNRACVLFSLHCSLVKRPFLLLLVLGVAVVSVITVRQFQKQQTLTAQTGGCGSPGLPWCPTDGQGNPAPSADGGSCGGSCCWQMPGGGISPASQFCGNGSQCTNGTCAPSGGGGGACAYPAANGCPAGWGACPGRADCCCEPTSSSSAGQAFSNPGGGSSAGTNNNPTSSQGQASSAGNPASSSAAQSSAGQQSSSQAAQSSSAQSSAGQSSSASSARSSSRQSSSQQSQGQSSSAGTSQQQSSVACTPEGESCNDCHLVSVTLECTCYVCPAGQPCMIVQDPNRPNFCPSTGSMTCRQVYNFEDGNGDTCSLCSVTELLNEPPLCASSTSSGASRSSSQSSAAACPDPGFRCNDCQQTQACICNNSECWPMGPNCPNFAVGWCSSRINGQGGAVCGFNRLDGSPTPHEFPDRSACTPCTPQESQTQAAACAAANSASSGGNNSTASNASAGSTASSGSTGSNTSSCFLPNVAYSCFLGSPFCCGNDPTCPSCGPNGCSNVCPASSAGSSRSNSSGSSGGSNHSGSSNSSGGSNNSGGSTGSNGSNGSTQSNSSAGSTGSAGSSVSQPNSCNRDTDCPEGQVCEDHQCTDSCQTDNDCPANQQCEDGACVDDCDSDNDCPAGQQCTDNGTCEPENPGFCCIGPFCGGPVMGCAHDSCQACTVSSSSSSSRSSASSSSTPNNICDPLVCNNPAAQNFCNALGRPVCVPTLNLPCLVCLDGCNDNNDCPEGEMCTNGTCSPDDCDDDNDCPQGEACYDGSCDPASSSASSQGGGTSSVNSCLHICGNGTRECTEECDDGNTRNNDGCNGGCFVEGGECGDGIIESLIGETCEPVLTDPSSDCNPNTCRLNPSSNSSVSPLPVCGNNRREGTEECDDGSLNGGPNSICNTSCRRTQGSCGNGVVESLLKEDCEPSLISEFAPLACDNNCHYRYFADSSTPTLVPDDIPNICSGQECSLGGAEFCGAQDASCIDDAALPCILCIPNDPSKPPFRPDTTLVFNSSTQASFKTSSSSSASSTPLFVAMAGCGNGELGSGEECDDGLENSLKPNAFCRPDCTFARCGDTVIDTPLETCDDGSQNGLLTSSCNAFCQNGTTSGVLPASVIELPFTPSLTFDDQPGSVDGSTAVGQGVSGTKPPATTASGPATIAIMAMGAAAGYAWMRRRR